MGVETQTDGEHGLENKHSNEEGRFALAGKQSLIEQVRLKNDNSAFGLISGRDLLMASIFLLGR